MKLCKLCNTKREYEMFTPHKAYSDGFYPYCKECTTKRTKDYYRTKNGISTRIYMSQKSACKKRGMSLPLYTRQEFKDWLFSQDNFDSLYKDWVNSDFSKDLKPSIDRLDDYKTYSFDNIQLVTWHENNMKGRRDIMIGKNKKYIKAIIQYDEDMNIIKEYHSLRQAERETKIKNSNLSFCCKNKNRKAGGFYWRYKGEEL